MGKWLTIKDLDFAQVERMRGVYGMSDAEIEKNANILAGNVTSIGWNKLTVKPSRRGKRFLNGKHAHKKTKLT